MFEHRHVTSVRRELDNDAPTSLRIILQRHFDESSTRFQCLGIVMYHQRSDLARQLCAYISKKNPHPSDVMPTIVQLDSNAWASSCTIREATSRDNYAPTYLKKTHPSDVMPTIVQLDSNAWASSCTISGATLQDNVAPTFPKIIKMPMSCRHKVSNQKPM